jgi:protein SCO1/2
MLGVILWLLTPDVPPSPVIGGTFTLTDGSGQTVSDRDYRGKFMLVYFGYTNCPDICPTTLYTIAKALPLMGKQANLIQPLFVTVDPIRDTPAVVGRYVALFSPRIVGLSGSASELQRIEQEYHVYVGPEDPKTGAIDHGAMLYLMGKNGEFLSGLQDDLSSAGLAAELTKVVTQYQS